MTTVKEKEVPTPTDLERMRLTCCDIIAKQYVTAMTNAPSDLRKKITNALMVNPAFKTSGKLFLKKEDKYDACSEDFKDFFKLLMSSDLPIDSFIPATFRVDIHDPQMVTTVHIGDMAPIVLLTREAFDTSKQRNFFYKE